MTFSGSQLTALDAPLLGVNIDHVATLRKARGGRFSGSIGKTIGGALGWLLVAF